MNIRNSPTWKREVAKLPYDPLIEDIEAEVVVIGGGLCGVYTTYLLAKAGKKVVLLEKDSLGDGATGLTTAFLTESLDTEPRDLISGFGEENAMIATRAHREAIYLIENLVEEHDIDCEFSRVSNYIYAQNNDEVESLKAEIPNYAKLGYSAEYFEKPLKGVFSTAYLEIKNQGKFEPLKFLYALSDIAISEGAEIYEDREVKEISPNKVILENGKTIKADKIICATYVPFGEPWGLYFKKGMYETYVLELQIENGEILDGIYEDMDNPYHYFRVDGNRMIIGGEDHRVQIKMSPEKNFDALREYIKRVFPSIDYSVSAYWSGPILEPSDGLAYIGERKSEKGVYYAFGFSGNGMTYSVIAGEIIANMILGKSGREEWQKVFDVGRIPPLKALAEKGRDYVEEFFG